MQPVEFIRDNGIETAEMWRAMRNDAAAAMERAFTRPPVRAANETLTRWVDRVRAEQSRAVLRWRVACDECARFQGRPT